MDRAAKKKLWQSFCKKTFCGQYDLAETAAYRSHAAEEGDQDAAGGQPHADGAQNERETVDDHNGGGRLAKSNENGGGRSSAAIGVSPLGCGAFFTLMRGGISSQDGYVRTHHATERTHHA